MHEATRDDLDRRELRISRRMDARGERGVFDCLLRMRGAVAGGRFRLGRLRAVGGEGAIFDLTADASSPVPLVGKIALAPWHRPIELTSRLLRKRRQVVVDEGRLLASAGSPFLPRTGGVHGFESPVLEHARGGAFAEPEPCLVMERIGGQDMDAWLRRVHPAPVDRAVLRRNLDRLAVGLIQALTDLERRGYLYADLRPGNLRVVGRPDRRIRLLDAGGCVPIGGDGSRFPHVPSYLPPATFREMDAGGATHPSAGIMAAMAGRTLFEVATGQAPKAGRHLDMVRLLRSPISPPVAEVVAALADGSIPTCDAALQTLTDRARQVRRR